MKAGKQPARAAGSSPIDADDGWVVRVASFEAERLHQRETIFTIGNGYLATRGAFEEGYPGDWRATFVHGVFDAAPAVTTELANLPDPLGLEVRLDGEPFNLARGRILGFEQELDLRSALLRRRVRWASDRGRVATLAFERFASFDDPHLVLQRCTITPEFDGVVEFRGWIDGTSENHHPGLLVRHFDTVAQGIGADASYLFSRTRTSRIHVAIAMALELAEGTPASVEVWDARDHPTRVLEAVAQRGVPIVVEKRVAILTSRDDAPDGLVASALRSLAAARDWHSSRARHAAAWRRAWDDCEVEIDGDPAAQLAIRFNLFHLLSAGPRFDDRVSIGAKTLSGFGYHGHAFWDTEIFMLPFFTWTRPETARNVLTSRWRQLGPAHARARSEGNAGARFPWESADTGDEVTPPWLPDPDRPTRLVRISTGDSELHISADVAYAATEYWRLTGDDDWYAERGAELVLATAAWWASRAEWLEDRRAFGYRGVIGPDEYHEHVDNNWFTNRMARWNIEAGLAALDWLAVRDVARRSRLVAELELTEDRLALWRRVAEQMYLPVRPDGLIEQFDGFLALRDVNVAALEPRTRSLQSQFGIEGVQETQAIKQPDVLMAIQLLPDEFSPAHVAANYAYYAPRTDYTLGSSLGPATAAIVACWSGRVEEAYELFIRGARVDLDDTRTNANDGIHGAAAGGAWQAVTFGFAGLRTTADGWTTNPALPAHWSRLSLRFRHRGVRQTVVIVNPTLTSSRGADEPATGALGGEAVA